MININNVCSPKVSVIIPTYGGSNSLRKAVKSVLEQSYNNYNVIVVDDNDPETAARKHTETIMSEFADNKKVIYLRHDRNKNGAAARNTGVSYSNSKYICLLDDDDFFMGERIYKQVNFLENNTQFQACYCWRNQNGRIICGTKEGDLTESILDLSFTPTTSAIMLSKVSYDSINGFDETYKRHQDYEFLLRYFEKYRMGVVPEVLLGFVGNEVDNQLYGEKLYKLKQQFFTQFSDDIQRIEKNNPGFRKRVYASHFASAVITLLRKGNIFLALKMYFNYGVKGGFIFWKLFFKMSFSGLLRKIKGIGSDDFSI